MLKLFDDYNRIAESSLLRDNSESFHSLIARCAGVAAWAGK